MKRKRLEIFCFFHMTAVIQVNDIIMQSSFSVPPKDQGDVSLLPSPVEKLLTQKMLESPGKTTCTETQHHLHDLFHTCSICMEFPTDPGEPNIPPGAIHSGKGLQNKSQFRTIAPKIAPQVLAPRVLPGPAPSLSDQANPGPSLSSKPLGMPPQNYTLMQVAGQEGTFSLFALPHVASAHPIQKPRLPLPENLKLPIPRYQPPRPGKGVRKKPGLGFSSERGCSKPAQTQAAPSPPEHPEPLHKPNSPKPAPDPALAALTNRSGPGDPRPPGTSNHGGRTPPATPALATPEEPSTEQGLPKSSGRVKVPGKKTPRKPSAVASEKPQEPVDATKAILSSPGVIGNAVQVPSYVPRGKLPILPYSRVKTVQVYRSKAAMNTEHVPFPGLRTALDQTPSIPEGFSAAPQVGDRGPAPPAPGQSPGDSTSCSATKPDLNHKTKLNGETAKRRGRKRKGPDELLTFQGKRWKCVLSCKDSKERVKSEPQESREQKPGTVKKYRSIMPKPVPALPALASPPATLQPPPPGSLGHLSFDHSLAPKHLDWKEDGQPPKPDPAFRNGFSGLRKTWHRCHVCDHPFPSKEHLREHTSGPPDGRPFSCRLCRKVYKRRGSLSAHVRLHHGDSRPRKLVCCEFCAKVFGHVRVYFGHLKEVHGVAISTDDGHQGPSGSPCEPQPGDLPRTREQTPCQVEGLVDRETKSSLEEDLLMNQNDEAGFQIRCGRCQITAQSLAEIKFHLLSVHGEEIQGQLPEESLPSPGSRAAQGELTKQAAPFWKRPERRKLLRHHALAGELCVVPRLKRQLYLHHQNDVETLTKQERAQPGPSEPGGDPQGPKCPGPQTALPLPQPGFNCVLCAQILGSKEELLLHWERQHKCEDPPKLWTIFSTLSSQGVVQLSSKTGK
ncbi:zinc finger protein 438 isoform X4 [Moschus berezovskii]|uniref:zinc finger protein 438 isoform X4 n=1 Tax=Moschus berezovskii TaxID=68408 RepID=UPI00244376F5|nr:zinc finger protein 438 isoform X4 [Moschus berezovskii]